MQVNSIKNFTNNRNQSPTFEAIKLYGGADETLKKGWDREKRPWKNNKGV